MREQKNLTTELTNSLEGFKQVDQPKDKPSVILYIFIGCHLIFQCKYTSYKVQVSINISISSNFPHFYVVKAFKFLSTSFQIYIYSINIYLIAIITGVR